VQGKGRLPLLLPTPSSYANRAPVPSQTALARPSHCSLSKASRRSTRPVLRSVSNLPGPICQPCPRSAPQVSPVRKGRERMKEKNPSAVGATHFVAARKLSARQVPTQDAFRAGELRALRAKAVPGRNDKIDSTAPRLFQSNTISQSPS